MPMQCNSCGMALNDNAKFCPGCGKPVHSVSADGSGQSAAPQVQVIIGGASTVGPGTAQSTNGMPLERSPKSHGTFIALAVLLGYLGVHNFYLGRPGLGAIQLLITFLSFGTLFWVSWIWAAIEVFVTDCDPQGRKLT